MDWSGGLPSDLLHLISRKLPDLSDFIRFRAVCKRWQFAAAPVTDPPRQLPWIIVKRDGLGLTSAIQFCSLSTGKVCTVNCSRAAGKRLVGSSHHYMLAFNRKRRVLSLLNPLTGHEVPLPPTDSSWHRPIYIGLDSVRNGGDVVICWDSLGIRTVGLCRPGDQEWKKFQILPGANGQTYCEGMYYVNETQTLTTKVIDLKTGTIRSTIPPLIHTSTGQPRRIDYLVTSPGELLGVCGPKSKWTCKTIRDYTFEVFRLDQEETKSPQWIKTDSIGDRVLFLDDTIGFSMNATEINRLKGDCIYFIAYLYPVDVDASGVHHEYPLCRYNMKNCKAQAVLPGELVNMSSWYFPSMH